MKSSSVVICKTTAQNVSLGCLCGVLLLCVMASYPNVSIAQDIPASVSSSTQTSGLEENLWSVILNGQAQHETALFLRNSDKKVFAAEKDLQHWRLQLPNVTPVIHLNEKFYALDGLAGTTYQIDEATQTIAIQVAGDQFVANTVTGRSDSPIPTPSSFGGFINYDAAVDYAQQQVQLNALTEFGLFSSLGVATSTVLAQNLTETARIIRLDSTWTTDFPKSMSSLRLGDTTSQAGEWGGAVHFGGVQWATNFNTQSRFIPFPMPAVAGEAALPSTVDVYVNNLLQLRTEVPPGPFTLNNLPVMTGQGNARIVVKDALGREQVISQPYYVSPQLLSDGTHQYSYETGWIRKNYGIESFDYGRAFLTATHRYGFTNQLTGEIHSELLKKQQVFGASGSYLWSKLGVFTIGAAGSHSDFGFSPLMIAGFQHQNKWFSINAYTRLAGKHFTQIGLQPNILAPRQVTNASANLSFGNYGSINVGYLHQDNRDKKDAAILNAGYNVSLGRIGSLHIGYFRSLKGLPDDTIAATFTFSLNDLLGEGTSASIGGTALQQNEQASVQIQKNLPRGNGFGYQLRTSQGRTEKYGASVSYQNDIGLYNIQMSHANNQTAFYGGISGGIAFIGGLQPHFARRLTDSFALIHLPDIANVRVYADNQLVGITNDDGEVLIPRLRPYQRNPIRIEQADLPFDTQFTNLEMETVPYFRSGYQLDFAVKRSRSALFRLQLANGTPMPSGALVNIIGNAQEFPVALRGEVFVTDLQETNQLRATWRGQSCEFTLNVSETSDALTDLGTINCLGVSP